MLIPIDQAKGGQKLVLIEKIGPKDVKITELHDVKFNSIDYSFLNDEDAKY